MSIQRNETEYIINQGAGAGGPPTAYGIFSDLIKIQERVEGF